MKIFHIKGKEDLLYIYIRKQNYFFPLLWGFGIPLIEQCQLVALC